MLNEILQIISMVLCLVGILQVLVGPKRWRGSVFFHIVFYIALFNYAISILLGLILEGHEGELVHRVMFISNFLEFISGYSLTFFVIKWLLHCVDPMREVKEIRVANILALVLYVLQLLMVIVSQFTGLCYSIGNDNYLQFGEGFFLLVLMWVPLCADPFRETASRPLYYFIIHICCDLGNRCRSTVFSYRHLLYHHCLLSLRSCTVSAYCPRQLGNVSVQRARK